MKYAFSSRIQGMTSSVVRDILKLTQGQDIVSFAGGLPAEDYFPMEAIRAAADKVLQRSPQALQYGITDGVVELRQGIANRMQSTRNISATTDEIIITSGSQQTLDLFVRAMVDPGDVVLVEDPTYLAFLQVLGMFGAKVIGVDSDENGMIPEDVEAKIKAHNPKFVYVVPTFSNPTGKVWSLERRQALLDICRKHETVILEDDPYGDLRFNGEAMPTIASLEGEVADRLVVYTSTFSKLVAPGLRTGWAVADKRIIQMIARGKQSADLHTSVLDQLILSELLISDTFSLDAHIEKISRVYGERMEAMASHLEHDPIWKDAKWSRPQGGMFIWVELPAGIDQQALLKCAVGKGVAFVPGSAFYAGEVKNNCIRLNYSFADREVLDRGMKRLSEALGEFLGRYAV